MRRAEITAAAAELGLSIAMASQVFTLGYFIGLFGFPYVAGSVIAARGIDIALFVVMGFGAVNVASERPPEFGG